jgi:endonuclease/exonuclease/phosphatase family metal-dependent hydrolase
MRFRLVTYNIHKGIGGVDRRYRPERIAEALRSLEPDILFLQEVDDGVPRSQGHRQVDWLGEALQMEHRAFQANVKLRRGHYGNAILSRFPLADVENIDLSIPFKKRRQALAAHCRVTTEEHQRTLALFNVHLGLAGFERTIQLRRLLSSRTLAGIRATTALVLGGDFNDVWGNLGRRVLESEGLQSAGGNILTFPAFRPLRPLDRIFYRGRLSCSNCFGSHSRLAHRASDHLPLVADFDLL